MPELPDVEGFRRTFAKHAAGQFVRSVRGVDGTLLRNASPQRLARALRGRRFSQPGRRGKLLICGTDGPTLLFHFGMTGEFVWSDVRAGAHRHDRMTIVFDHGELRYRDMRKFGGIWLARDAAELDAIVGRLGPDWLEIGLRDFRRLLAQRRGSLKATLMDQALAAGLGNLIADESLWRARLDPRRPVSSLSDAEVARLYRAIRKVLDESLPYGLIPSNRRWLMSVRGDRDAHCPRCGTRLERVVIGGRTTVYCPNDQR
jgi:formamidopyrimidine-DNA glycosylase